MIHRVHLHNDLREYKIIDRNRLPTVSNLTLVHLVVQVNERLSIRANSHHTLEYVYIHLALPS